MNGLRGIGKGAAAKLPSRHPILRLQNQVGGFAHLLTRELVADGVYWRGVERLVQGKRVVGTSDRRHIPALMLPVFKRMIETPFDLLVSIPRAGDPLAYALYRMAEYSERMGVELAKLPTHESFGGGSISVPVVNFNFLQDAEGDRAVAPGTKARIYEMLERLPADKRELLFRRNSFETFQAALDENLVSVVRWFMSSESGIYFAEAAASLVSELMRETYVALALRKARRILLLDDCTNDLFAYNSVYYPLCAFAPQAAFEVGLLSGNEHDVKDLDAVCGCFHGAWVMMSTRDEWTGEKTGISSGELGKDAAALLWPAMRSEMPVEDEHARAAIFSLLISKVLYKEGLVFSQGASWVREKLWQRFVGKYGEESLLAWQALVEKKVTPQFVEALKGSSPLFARMTQGRLEVDRAVEKLFGDDMSERLLALYLKSGHGYEDLRPISDLLVLINQ